MELARHKLFILLIVPALLIASLSRIAAQTAPEADLFEPVRTIGQDRPSGLLYDANFDRFVWVDEAGQLVVVDALTLAPLHVIYESGVYSAFSFSRSGKLLAVAIDVRVDVWDVASGVRVASFEPPGARRLQGPIQFTRDDELLVVNSIVPAPQELRRSENDTVILPWVWDIAAAREQRNSVLVNRVAAYPFYNVRVNMIAGDNGILVSGLDNRIQVYDADTPTMQMIADLPAVRLETVPVRAWHSATDPYLYVSLNDSDRFVQINTETNEVLPFSLGSDMSVRGLDQLRALSFSRAAQPIGDNTNQYNPLTGLLLGSDYPSWTGYRGAVFSLFDVLLPLVDNPLNDPSTGTALLAYHFNEYTGYGATDAYHPSGVNGIALSPDDKQLAFRRQSGEVALYDIASGALEHIFTPSEPDPDGKHTLAYTADGATLVIDFERFDAKTGDLINRATNFTTPFDSYVFSDDGSLITFGGSPLKHVDSNALTWRLWDIENGHLLREDSFAIDGDSIVAVSDDRLRYLTQTIDSAGGADVHIIDGRAGETHTFHVDPPTGDGIRQIIPNDDWSRFLIVYEGGPLAVYSREGQSLYFADWFDLPYSIAGYGWRDDRTIFVQSYGGMPSQPPMGIQYHPSGLPQCVVDALPDSWTSLVPAWERLVYQGEPGRVDDIARQLCTALTGDNARNLSAAQGTPTIPQDATAVAGLLTPSPTVEYVSARTPAPIAVPGVPTCITTRYRSQAAAYADLWRQVTAGITDPAQLEAINTMICEGLLSDLGFVQPTPTVNPNALSITTPTPLPDAPETTGGDENGYNLLTIDVETGLRAFASAVVPTPQTPQPDPIALLNNFFRDQYRVYPNNPVVSPDGRLMAAQDADGYVTIYRLKRSVPELLGDEGSAVATRAADAPRSIGLAPTATLPPQALGTALPTLTPTMTVTPIPLTDTQANLPQLGETQFVCPARQMARLPDLPDGFNPPGTLIVDPANSSAYDTAIWTLDPSSGKLAGDPALPRCGTLESCSISPDGAWMVRQTSQVAIVSRPDGSDAITLYAEPEVNLLGPSFSWEAPHRLLIRHYGVLPTLGADQRILISRYDPDTRSRSEGALEATPVPLGLLPFDVVSRQPYGALELLAESFSGGTRFYLRDSETGAVTLFAQDLAGWDWQPAGRFLYYAKGEYTYQYDTLTESHSRLYRGWIPSGMWSPDGHLLANWLSDEEQTTDEALLKGELPPRLQVWNSDSGLTYTYCLPELSRLWLAGTPLVWSPDSRYLAFTVSDLLPDGDIAPTPTFAISPEAPPATSTPIPLETQYEYRSPRTIILDTTSGNAAIVSVETSAIERWMGE